MAQSKGESSYAHSYGDSYLDPFAATASSVRYLRQILIFEPSEKGSNHSFPPLFNRILLGWLALVEMYSRCELTKESDKLTAIAGMARHIQAKIGQRWCAGIWEDSICQGLLWFSTKTGLTAPMHPRAPSWSWPAWDGAMQYPVDIMRHNFLPMCQFVSLQNDNGHDVDWLNATGRLTLKGKLAELHNLYFGDAIQVGPGPGQRGIISDDLDGLPLMKVKTHTPAFWIRNIEGSSMGWIVFDYVDTKFVSQHSIPGSFDATARMKRYEERFRPKSLFEPGEELYFLVLGSIKKGRDLSTNDYPEAISNPTEEDNSGDGPTYHRALRHFRSRDHLPVAEPAQHSHDGNNVVSSDLNRPDGINPNPLPTPLNQPQQDASPLPPHLQALHSNAFAGLDLNSQPVPSGASSPPGPLNFDLTALKAIYSPPINPALDPAIDRTTTHFGIYLQRSPENPEWFPQSGIWADRSRMDECA